jgi:hypothetical protein
VDVPLGSDLSITFSEVVTQGVGNITIREVDGGGTFEAIVVTSGQVTGWGTTSLTIDPSSNYASETAYYVEIDAGAIVDGASNPFAGISGSSTWDFVTASGGGSVNASEFEGWGILLVLVSLSGLIGFLFRYRNSFFFSHGKK